MRAIKAICIAAAVVFPFAGARGEGAEHPQGRLAYGEGLGEENELYLRTLDPPPVAGSTADGVIKNGAQQTPFRLKFLEDCDRLGGTLPTLACRAVSIPPEKSSVAVPICQDAFANALLRKWGTKRAPTKADTELSLVIVEGHWEANNTYVKKNATVGCSVDDDAATEPDWGVSWTAAMAKCVWLWHMNSAPNTLRSCVHMARAAYDGRTTETLSGTMVDAWDGDGNLDHGAHHERGCVRVKKGKAGKPGYTQDAGKKKDLCSMWFESGWDQNGARCVNHKRWVDLGKPPYLGAAVGFPNADDNKNGQIHCRPDVAEGLKGDREKAMAENAGKLCIPLLVDNGALVGNRSEMHKKNTNMPNTIIPPPELPRMCWDSSEWLGIGCPDPWKVSHASR